MAIVGDLNLGSARSGPSATLNLFSRKRTGGLTWSYFLNFRNLTIVICFVFSALSAHAQTSDFDKNWTAVGSDGTVDEASAGKVFFDNSKVQKGRLLVVGGSAKRRGLIAPATDSAVIRYNVTAVDSFFVPLRCEPGASGHIQLRLRYLSGGNGARVVAKLIEVDMASGTETTRLTFDSRAFPLSNNYQVQSSGLCGRPWTFDFERKAYYIEATLTSSSFFSAAGIQIIQIDNFVSP
jgi:hypothetical protein